MHASVAGQDQLAGAILRRACQPLDRRDCVGHDGPVDMGEHRFGDWSAGRRLKQVAAGAGERHTRAIEFLAVAQALALALLADPQLQLAVEPVEVLQRVVLGAPRRGGRERDQRRQPTSVRHLGQIASASRRRIDAQCAHPRDREHVETAEAVGERAQLADSLHGGDQAGHGRLDRRAAQPLKLRFAPPTNERQQHLQAGALLVGEPSEGGAFDAALARGVDSRQAFELKIAYGLAERDPEHPARSGTPAARTAARSAPRRVALPSRRARVVARDLKRVETVELPLWPLLRKKLLLRITNPTRECRRPSSILLRNESPGRKRIPSTVAMCPSPRAWTSGMRR